MVAPIAEPASGRRYAGRSSEERRAERRVRLLDAGLELFAGRGYAHTTVEAICAAAGLNPRYLYEQFDGREVLLEAVYDRHVERVAAAVLAARRAAPLRLRARCEAALGAFVDAQLADERSARINYVEVVGVSPRLEAHRRAVLHQFAAVVEDDARALARAGEVADRDHGLTAVALVGATDGLLIDWLVHDRRAGRAAIVSELVELYVAAITRGATP